MRRPTDPIGNFRFLLELGFIPVAGFSEVTGLQLETKAYEYREGGRNSHALKFPDVGSVGNITLKRGVLIGSQASSNLLFQWQADVMTGSFDRSSNLNLRKSDPDEDIDNRCAIVLLDEQGLEAKRWTLFRVFPLKWVGPELKANAGEIAIETLELACENIEVAR